MPRTPSAPRRAGSFMLLALASVGARAQSPASSAMPPLAPSPTPLHLEDVATAPGALSAINGTRSVSGGAVFVNDRARRRIVMPGRDLRESRVVLDGSPENGQRYGRYATRLFALTGDSTAFLDVESRTITVIDPAGDISRRASVPKQADLESLLSGTPAVDERGRLIYRGRGVSQQELLELGAMGMRGMAESVPLLRVDLTSGRLDTVTTLRIYQQRERRVPNGSRISYQPVLHPAPTVDEWVMLADGRIAADRVRLPAGAVIVGFQAGGGVLLATRDRGTLRLRRASYAKRSVSREGHTPLAQLG
jgi:hypothetical protein